jgi:streptomycin 6-kinase
VNDAAPWQLRVPEAFAAGVRHRTGALGAAWLASLPEVVRGLLTSWGLVPDGPVAHGYLGVVIPVRRGRHRYALKVSQPSTEVDNQAVSLALWHGRGMVHLIESDVAAGALLMEWLDPDHSLDDLELDEAIAAAAALLRRLAVPADGAPLPTLADHVASWPDRWVSEWARLGRPLPRRLLDAAGERSRAFGPRAGRLLVDHDLHYRNVLAGERERWLAVDPRGVVGDAEFALAPLLWNRFVGPDEVPQRFARFVDVGGLDRELAEAWTLVRVVDYFLWSTAAGLTWDPAACRVIADWLVDHR